MNVLIIQLPPVTYSLIGTNILLNIIAASLSSLFGRPVVEKSRMSGSGFVWNCKGTDVE
jgi:hypothetical protein